MKRFLALLAILVVAVTIAPSQMTEAHSRPIRFDPEPGAVLESAPAQVTGWFTSDIRRDDASFIRVLDVNKVEVDSGTTELSSDRKSMSVALNPGVGPGLYVVHWSTYDDGDNEVFSACHTFFVGQAAADAALAQGRALDGGELCPNTAPVSSATVDFDVSLSGSDATVTIQPTNFTSRAPDGSTRDGAFGHYHIYLDKVPLDVLEAGHSHDDTSTSSSGSHSHSSGPDPETGLPENPVQWIDNTYTFTNLSPGRHTIAVALMYDDHTPMSPPIVTAKTVTVGGSGDDGGGVPLWVLMLGLVGALGAGLAGGKLLARQPS